MPSPTSSASRKAPESALACLPWSFSEPTSASLPEFLDRVDVYARERGYSSAARELQRRFPSKVVDIEYRYLLEVEGHGARELRHIYVRIGSDNLGSDDPRLSFPPTRSA